MTYLNLKIILRCVSLIALFGISVSLAHAGKQDANRCFRFDITDVSEGLTDLKLKLKNKTATLSVSKKKLTQSAEFKCEPKKTSLEMTCSSDHGDFFLTVTHDSVLIQFVYLNLAPHKKGLELTDEFAIFKRSDDEGGHTKVSNIYGSKTHCLSE